MTKADRRKIERMTSTTKAHVTVMAGGDLLPARVTNISRVGVAVIYENSRIPCCNTRVRVDILANGRSGLVVTGLRCRTVYDLLTLAEGTSYRGLFARQCGLEFVAPSDAQNHLLGRLIAGIR